MADDHYESPESRDVEMRPVKVRRPGGRPVGPQTLPRLRADRKRFNDITQAVCDGNTLRMVAEKYHVSMNTLQALLATHPELQRIQKERQASLYRFASIAAVQSYIDDLEAGLIKPEAKCVHSAVFADKAAAAAGEAQVVVRHESGPSPEELREAARKALAIDTINIAAEAKLDSSQVADSQQPGDNYTDSNI